MHTVLHCSAGSPAAQRRALANARNLVDALGAGEDEAPLDALRLVCNGDGVYALLARGETADAVRELLAPGTDESDGPTVAVAACGNSLGARGLDSDALVEGVDVVPSGVGELARRQADGAAYLKVP